MTDRPAAGREAAGPLYTAFDLETTGLFPGAHRIVEIGAVTFGGEHVLRRFQTLVDPGVPMPDEARRVNGISDDMLRGQPSLADVLPRFLAFLGQSIPVAHNAPFDVGFLRAAAGCLALALPGVSVLDTRVLAARAFPGLCSYSLDSLRARFCLDAARDGAGPVAVAHRAAGDAEACRRLFLLCAEALERQGRGRPESLAALSGPGDGFAGGGPSGGDHVAALDRAIRDRRLVEISYISGKGERTLRRILPLSLVRLGGSLAVEAFCHLRGEKRTFMLSSIEEIRGVPH